MGEVQVRVCERCGAPESAEVYVSRRGLCAACAVKGMTEAATQMAERSGPRYEKYLDRDPRGLGAAEGDSGDGEDPVQLELGV